MSNDAATDVPPLPAVFYWSASLAAQSNQREGHDDRHGLIDATVPTVMQHWVDGDGWCLIASLPADARRLVCEAPAPRTSAHRLNDTAEDMERVLALTEDLPGIPAEVRRLVTKASSVTSREAEKAARPPAGLVELRKLIRDAAADDSGDDEAYTYDVDDETCERIATVVLARFGVQA